MTDPDPGARIVRLRLNGPQVTLGRLREFVAVIGDLVQEVAAEVPGAGPGSCGIIRQRQGRDALRIEVTSLRAFPDEQSLPSADDVRGILRERPRA